MKKKLAILLAGVMVLSMLAGCGSSGSDTAADTAEETTAEESTEESAEADTEAEETAAADTEWPEDVQAIIDRGVLRVGVKSDVIGFGYQDPLTGDYSGMEIDLAQMIADALGVDVE